MKRRHRLRGSRAFTAVRGWRTVSRSGPLRVNVAPNQVGVARIGFVIPRSVGGAVTRNRVRRRLRELLRPHLAELAGCDLVVAVDPGAAATDAAELAGHLELCLAGVGARLRRDVASPPLVDDNGGTPASPPVLSGSSSA